MTVRQCLSSFGPDHRCVLQEQHIGWHSDHHRTIWADGYPGDREWLTPADAERFNEIRRQEREAQAEAARIAADAKKLKQAQKIAEECIVSYGPAARVYRTEKPKPERAQGAAPERRRRDGIEAALWLLSPELDTAIEELKKQPEKEPQTANRWKSHHLLHPGAWMMAGRAGTFENDYDPLAAEIHAELEAAGIV
jgi:hypothetical protein